MVYISAPYYNKRYIDIISWSNKLVDKFNTATRFLGHATKGSQIKETEREKERLRKREREEKVVINLRIKFCNLWQYEV